MNRDCDLGSLFARDDDVESAMRVLDELGIQLKYENGTFVGICEVLNEITKSFSSLNCRAVIEATDTLVSFGMKSKADEETTEQNALDTFLSQFRIRDGRCMA